MRSTNKLLVFGILFFIVLFLNINFSSAFPLGVCSVRTESACNNDGYQIVLRLSGTTNAHVALINPETSFPGNNVLCCNFGTGNIACNSPTDPTNQLLSISSSGNAHAEKPNLVSPEYSTDACYDVKSCRTTTSNCLGNEWEIVRLNSIPGNTHLGGEGSGYANKVCCKVDIQGSTDEIVVSVPNGEQNWAIDSSQTITWTSSPAGAISNVDIWLSVDNGDNWDLIFDDIANDNSKAWTIPAEIGDPIKSTITTNAKIRISDAAEYLTQDQSDAVFTISEGTTPPPGPIPTGCFLDSHWEKDGVEITGTNDDDLFIEGTDANMIIEGNGACVDAFILVKNDVNDQVVGSDNVAFSGADATGTWTTDYPDSSLGYIKRYFTATDSGASTIDSRSGTGYGFIRVFTSEGIIGCESYTDHGEEVCLDDPIGKGQEIDEVCSEEDIDCYCSWNVDSCEPVIDASGSSEPGLCTWSQDTEGDTCENDGFLVYKMIPTWIGESTAPEWCVNIKSESVKCPAQIALPFFNKSTFILTIVAIFGIYFLAGLRKNRKK